MVLPVTPTAANKLYVLDTNILIHGVRGNATWQRIKDLCDPLGTEPRPVICIVTDGELRSFAQQVQWGESK